MNDDIHTAPPPTEWPELPDPGMLDKIIDVIAEEGQIERSLIVPEATLETLELESMEVVMILMGLEDVLDAYIPMNTDLSSARNLAELIGAAIKTMNETAAEMPKPA